MASVAGVSCPCATCKGKPVSSVKVRNNHMKICYTSDKCEVATVTDVPQEKEESEEDEEEIVVEFFSEVDEVSLSKL